MSATKEQVSVDREALLRFIVEMDAVATVDSIKSSGESPLVNHIYRVIEDFEVQTFGYRLAADEHASALRRGRELFEELYAS